MPIKQILSYVWSVLFLGMLVNHGLAEDQPLILPANIAPTPITAPPQTPVEVEGKARTTQGHPCCLWDQQDIDEIKGRLKTDPELQKIFAALKDAMDKRITEPLGVPEAGGPAPTKDVYHAHGANSNVISDLGTMYVLTGDEKYGEFAKQMLVAYAKAYPGLTHPDGWVHNKYRSAMDGRLTGQFLDDGCWLARVARGADLVYNVKSWTPEERKLVQHDLFEAVSSEFFDPIIKDRYYVTETHNRADICTSAVLMSGYATDDDKLINIGLYGVDGTADKPTGGVLGVYFTPKCIFEDGLWNEGAPGYQLQIASAGLMNDAETLWHHGIDLYRYNNCILKRLLDSSIGLAYPDSKLSLPALHDSAPLSLLDDRDWFSSEANAPFEYGYRRYKDPAYIPIARKGAKSLSMSIHSGPPSLFQDLPDDSKVPPRKIESANYYSVGYGVLRLPAPKGYNQVLLEYGPSGSHGHPSKLGIDVYAMEDPLLVFPGVIFPYNDPRDPKWYWTTLGNCTLTVDEKSQILWANLYQFPKGTPNAEAKQVLFGPATTMGIQRAWADNLYPEKIAQDRSLFLTTNYMADLFSADAAANHKYDLAWHIRGTFPADMKMEPYAFPEPVSNGYNALTNVQHVSSDQPWTTTITTPKGAPARFFAPGGTPTEFITGIGLFLKESPPAIIERRIDQKNVLFGNVIDLSGAAEPYVKSVTQEGGVDSGYGLLKVQTAKGTDLCFTAFKQGKMSAGGLETDAQQALVSNDGAHVQALYLGGGTTLKAGDAAITRSDVGLAYVEKLNDGSYIVANPSPTDATITVTLAGLDNLSAFLVDRDNKQLGPATVTRNAAGHSSTIQFKADSRVQFTAAK